MKYFAISLPIEGEVNEGDKYYWKSDLNKQIFTRNGKDTSPSLQKVKLFLCSRYIQDGDRIFCLDEMEHPEDAWRTYKSTDTCKADIKVIGEISPDATWVKEGDEFDEEDIKWHPYAGGTKSKYLVKGPCGHFH